jgi:hypothetical protein
MLQVVVLSLLSFVHTAASIMAEPIASDVFKFVSLRAPEITDHDLDAVRVIRDHRIRDPHVPGATSTPAQVQMVFAASPVGKFVTERLAAMLPAVSAANPVGALNQMVAEDVRTQFGIFERTNRPWIDEFVAIIRQHVGTLMDVTLLRKLTDVVQRHFPHCKDIADYVELVADVDQSRFCYDIDYLFDRLYVLYIAKRLYPLNLEFVLDGLRALHVIRQVWLSRSGTSTVGVIGASADEKQPARTDCAARQLATLGGTAAPIDLNSADTLRMLWGATPVIHRLFAYLLGYYKPFNPIVPVGIGDLLVVKQFLCRYRTGEVAHVENVLKGELKRHTLRHLDRLEDIVSASSETIEDTVRDLQTADRFELKTETESTVTNDLNISMNTTVSGKYGYIEFSAAMGLSYGLSTSDSRRSASNYARDVVDRSLTRVQKRVTRERVTRTTSESEDTNLHELNNVPGTGHVTGVYRYLDKQYRAQVYNYGKRMMFEFIVPEPAAFIMEAFERARRSGVEPDKPQLPAKPNLVISSINDAAVNTYAALYNLTDLAPEPAASLELDLAFTMGGISDAASAHEKIVNVPSGYVGTSVTVAGGYEGFDKVFPNPDHGIFLSVGGQTVVDVEAGVIHETFESQTITLTAGATGSVGLSLIAYKVKAFAIAVSVKCDLTAEAKRKWQIQTYTRIMDAYDRLLSEYRTALSAYEDKLESRRLAQGVQIQGRNPGINQEIIRTELKKHCVSVIARQFDAATSDDIVFDAMQSRAIEELKAVRSTTETTSVTTTTPAPGTTVTTTSTTVTESASTTPVRSSIPAIDLDRAAVQGRVIQFLEQAFEWPQISYVLYPYFWGRLPEKWFDAQKYYDEVDPLFAKFLQAGSARVLIAVRPNYNDAVLHYLATRTPWNGGPAPGLDSPLYVPIHQELREQQDDLNGAVPYGDAWNVIVPTRLVYLQQDATLPTFDCVPPFDDPV